MIKKRYVFGDIHGHYDSLVSLLNSIGVGLNPSSVSDNVELIFLGDLIDRGPDSEKVVSLVKSFVDAGVARAILGNHEYNFVQLNTETEPGSGIYRRPRSNKNITEVAETWSSYRHNGKHNAALLNAHIEWFKTLPIAISTGELQMVHACWDKQSLAMLEKNGEGYYLTPEIWDTSWVRDTPPYEAIETLCKGHERDLPNGITFRDKGGVERSRTRVAWWNTSPVSWDDYMLSEGADLSEMVGDPPNNDRFEVDLPTLFGHYWAKGAPRLISTMVSCLDFSIAAPKGYLTCYEHHNGDTQLHQARLISVQRLTP
jgi:hypothetical protein